MKSANQYMVIDDDLVSNLVCNHIILKFDKDAQITIFTDPEKALQFIRKTFTVPIDNSTTVMFLDINMPTMSGWEFLEVFETFGEHIHMQFNIFLLSSSIDQEDIRKAEHHLFVQGYYPKPLSPETLSLISDKI